MDLRKCENCGESYDSTLLQCPNCGFGGEEPDALELFLEEAEAVPENTVALEQPQTDAGVVMEATAALEAGQAQPPAGAEPDAPVKKTKNWKRIVLITAAAVAVIALVVSSVLYFIPEYFYNTGAKLYGEGQYQEAAEAYDKAGDYKDAPAQAVLSRKAQAYADGEAAFAAGEFLQAEEYFLAAEDYEDAAARAKESVLANHYTLGCGHLEQGEYRQAIDEFAHAGDYSDTAEKTLEAYYGQAKEYEAKGELLAAAESYSAAAGYADASDRVMDIGKKLMTEGSYADGAEVFALLKDAQASRYAAYCRGMDAFGRRDYAEAAENFGKAGDVEDAADKRREANYLEGLNLLAKKDFSGAKNRFEAVGDYESANHLVTVCEAELKIRDGYLSKGVELYSQVPKDLTVEGFDLPGRRAQVEKAKPFAAITGNWKVTKNYIESRCHYRFGSRWWNWYHDTPISGQTVDVKCYLQDDGTVQIEGSVTFYRFTNYSSYSSQCNASSTTQKFTLKNQTSVPRSISIGAYGTLSWGNGYSLRYSKRDEGTSNFYYKYNSNVTYGNRISAY